MVVPDGGAATPPVKDLMSALRASIEAAKQRKGASHEPVAAAAREEHPKASNARKPAAKKPGKKRAA